MAVSKRLRYEILRRDNHTCRYCGLRAADTELTVDHVLPVALGGGDEATNLVAACRDCNAGKTSVHPDAPLVDNVAEDALRWSAAMRWAAEQQQANREAGERVADAVDVEWSRWLYSDGQPATRPANWRGQVGRWVKAGIDADTLVALVADVLPRPVQDDRMWPYFCGAVRNVLTERADIAREYLDAEGD